MTTSELFRKHFGDTCQVDMKHQNVESFFDELTLICQEEDRAADYNPYLLSGVELERATDARKAGKP